MIASSSGSVLKCISILGSTLLLYWPGVVGGIDTENNGEKAERETTYEYTIFFFLCSLLFPLYPRNSVSRFSVKLVEGSSPLLYS